MVLGDWQNEIGNAATVCTIGMFLSGLDICAKFYKNKTTGEVSPMSFLVGMVMTFVWYNYGQLIGDSNISTVNGTGLILQSLYTLIFYLYTANKTNMTKKIFLVMVLQAAVHFYISTGSDVTTNIGLIAASMSVAYCGAPLASVRHVIRTKSADVLPFFLILMTVFVTGLWTVYGTILDDPFVKVPNGLSFLIAVFQLSLFFYYPVQPSHLPANKSEVFIS